MRQLILQILNGFGGFVSCIRSRQLPNTDVLEGHLSCLMIHFANIGYRLGSESLAIDPKTESIANSDEERALLKQEYRKPRVIPVQV